MAMAVGLVNIGAGSSSASSTSWTQTHRRCSFLKNNRKAQKNVISCVASSYSAATSGMTSLTDQYRTLRIQPGASEREVKKAFRQLALQYHPDVCKGNNCGVQFHHINEAYDTVISYSRGEENNTVDQYESHNYNEPMRGMCDNDWDMWEEWMGWEGAGTRDYTSHINPYI